MLRHSLNLLVVVVCHSNDLIGNRSLYPSSLRLGKYMFLQLNSKHTFPLCFRRVIEVMDVAEKHHSTERRESLPDEADDIDEPKEEILDEIAIVLRVNDLLLDSTKISGDCKERVEKLKLYHGDNSASAHNEVGNIQLVGPRTSPQTRHSHA